MLLVIVGAANWLLVGIAKFAVVAALTSTSFGHAISTVIYVLVGISSLGLLPVLTGWATAADRTAA